MRRPLYSFFRAQGLAQLWRWLRTRFGRLRAKVGRNWPSGKICPKLARIWSSGRIWPKLARVCPTLGELGSTLVDPKATLAAPRPMRYGGIAEQHGAPPGQTQRHLDDAGRRAVLEVLDGDVG